MGIDKALLKFPDGRTFVETLVSHYKTFGADPVVLVINEKIDQTLLNIQGCLCIINRHPEWGRFYSIRLGLDHVPAGACCFIQNVDNPFVHEDLSHGMLRAVLPAGFVVPATDRRAGHPLLLGEKMVDELRAMDNKIDFREVLKTFPRIEINFPDPRIHWNINTPEDYQQFIKSI